MEKDSTAPMDITERPNPTTTTNQCPSSAGYHAHVQRQETTCAPCRAAHAAYQRNYIKTTTGAAATERHRTSRLGRVTSREGMARYRATPKGRATIARYRATPKGQATKARYQAAHRAKGNA